MATVNKQSLREAFDALKGEFERLCASGKMAADSRALFQAMLMLFEVLMVVFMEKRTPKNSANSSKPSSQTPKDDTAITHPGANSKGNKHNAICQACLRPRDRFWDIPVPKIDSAFDNLLVPQPSWSPSTTQQLRKLVAAPYLAPNDWTPRSEAYFVFPLAQGTPGKQCGLAATGVYQPSLRSPWLAACDNTRTVETVHASPVSQCETCGEDLSKTPCQGVERRTRIDIIFEKVVTHVDAEIKQCPQCRTRNKGPFPADMAGPVQYGPGIKGYVMNLLIAQMISLKRVQQSIQTLIGQILSEATILKYVMQLHHTLAAWEQSAIEQLLQMPAMHVDETSLRVDRKNHWIHVCSAGHITYKFLHPKRGLAAIEASGVIPRYGGVIIHDCWASYLSYDQCGHGLCGSHLLRELTFVIDSNNYAWAANMKRLLQETCAIVAKRQSKRLTGNEYKNLQKRYRNILTRGAKQLPPIPLRQNGKRGRVAKSDAHNLWERLKKHETAVLLFARLSYVPFTNNRAERDLRMSKVKQKVSGCFRTRKHAEAYCRISSYLQTMANQGYNPLVAIQMAFSGQLYADRGE